jgi:hypothetical protein
MAESFIFINQIGKMSYQAGGLQKIEKYSKKIKIGGKLVEKTEKFH